MMEVGNLWRLHKTCMSLLHFIIKIRTSSNLVRVDESWPIATVILVWSGVNECLKSMFDAWILWMLYWVIYKRYILLSMYILLSLHGFHYQSFSDHSKNFKCSDIFSLETFLTNPPNWPIQNSCCEQKNFDRVTNQHLSCFVLNAVMIYMCIYIIDKYSRTSVNISQCA